MKKSILVRAAFGICLAGLLTMAAGCGPSRKEYAINEALLIDQTRILENQLYSAHFQIQNLEQENKQLRTRLEAKGEKLDDIPKTENFDAAPEMSVSRASVPRPSNRYASQNNARSQAAAVAVNRVQAQPLQNQQMQNRAVKTASRTVNNRAAVNRTANNQTVNNRTANNQSVNNRSANSQQVR